MASNYQNHSYRNPNTVAQESSAMPAWVWAMLTILALAIGYYIYSNYQMEETYVNYVSNDQVELTTTPPPPTDTSTRP